MAVWRFPPADLEHDFAVGYGEACKGIPGKSKILGGIDLKRTGRPGSVCDPRHRCRIGVTYQVHGGTKSCGHCDGLELEVIKTVGKGGI